LNVRRVKRVTKLKSYKRFVVARIGDPGHPSRAERLGYLTVEAAAATGAITKRQLRESPEINEKH
jgi:hypothetical protein